GEHLFHFSRDNRFNLIGGDRLVVAPFAHRSGDLCRALDAEVGANQHIPELLAHRLAPLALGDKIGDSAADRSRGALETSAEPLPPTLFLCRLMVIIVPGGWG